MATLKDLLVSGPARVIGKITATSFVKNGATAGNILLAGGGDMAQSAFAVASHNHDSDYLKLSGGTMTGTITRTFSTTGDTASALNVNYTEASTAPALDVKSSNKDVWVWKVDDYSTPNYGFGIKYIGSGTGNNNDLVLYADNQAGTQKEAYRVKQDGSISFCSTPKVGSTNLSLADHVHGEITSDGKLTTERTIANGDGLVVVDHANGELIKRSSISFGTDTAKYLSNKGTWEDYIDTDYVIVCENQNEVTIRNKTGSSKTQYTPKKGVHFIYMKYENLYRGNYSLRGKFNGIPDVTNGSDIYIDGENSTNTNKNLPAGLYAAYYDGTNWRFRTDGRIDFGGTTGFLKSNGTVDTTTYLSELPSSIPNGWLGSNSGQAAPGDHTHAISIKNNGTNVTGSLSANTQYTLTAGGDSVDFTTPTDTNYYPTNWEWTNGTTAGPTAELQMVGGNNVSIDEIPSASATASGVVTTDTQEFSGVKKFKSDVWLYKSTTDPTPSLVFQRSDDSAGYDWRIQGNGGYLNVDVAANAAYTNVLKLYTNAVTVASTVTNGISAPKFVKNSNSTNILLANGEDIAQNTFLSSLPSDIPSSWLGSDSDEAAPGNHTHEISIKNSSNNTVTNLSANTQYTLTAGGSNYTFKTPGDSNSFGTAYCDTGPTLAAKEAKSSNMNFGSRQGDVFLLCMKSSNTYNGNLTLSVNSGTARPLFVNDTQNPGNSFTAGMYLVYFNGERYVTYTNRNPFADNDTNYYPTQMSWNGGTTDGPTATITMNNSSYNVSVGSIPKATESASGVVTTGDQTFAGTKSFNSAPKLATNTIATSSGNTQTFPDTDGTVVNGTGTSGYIAKWNGTNSITDGPKITSNGTGYLKENGTWDTPTNTDTKVKQTTVDSGEHPILFSAETSLTSGTAYEAQYSAKAKIDSSGNLILLSGSSASSNNNSPYLILRRGNGTDSLVDYGIRNAGAAFVIQKKTTGDWVTKFQISSNGNVTITGDDSNTGTVTATKFIKNGAVTGNVLLAGGGDIALDNIDISSFTNDAGYTTNTGTVTQVTVGVGLNTTNNDTSTDGGSITSTGTIYLTKTAVTPGTYQGITVDKYGRVTGATNMGYTTNTGTVTGVQIGSGNTITPSSNDGVVQLPAYPTDYLTSHQTIKVDGMTGATTNHYGTCSTPPATSTKQVFLVSGGGTPALENGLRVIVKFTTTNSAASPTLQVGNTEAKTIYYRGSAITSSNNDILKEGRVYEFVYDGAYWQLVGDIDSTVQSSDNFGTVVIENDGNLDKTATIPWGYTLTSGNMFIAHLRITNTKVAPKLNINSTGSIEVKLNGGSIGSSDNTWVAGTYLCLYDGTYYQMFNKNPYDYNNLSNVPTIPGDTKVTQTARTTNGNFPILLRGTSAGTSSTTTTTTFKTTTVINPSTGNMSTPGTMTSTGFVKSGATATNVLLAGGGDTAQNAHTHGEITSDGKLETDRTIANGDRLVVVDSTNGNLIKRSSISFGTNTTKYLRNDGTWETPSGNGLPSGGSNGEVLYYSSNVPTWTQLSVSEGEDTYYQFVGTGHEGGILAGSCTLGSTTRRFGVQSARLNLTNKPGSGIVRPHAEFDLVSPRNNYDNQCFGNIILDNDGSGNITISQFLSVGYSSLGDDFGQGTDDRIRIFSNPILGKDNSTTYLVPITFLHHFDEVTGRYESLPYLIIPESLAESFSIKYGAFTSFKLGQKS